jgi:hypothetical protein
VINSFADEEAVSYSKDELDRFISFLAGEDEIGTHVQIELIQGSPQKKEEFRTYNSKYPFADYNSTTPPSEQDTYEIEQGLVGCTQPEKVVETGKEVVKIKFYIAKSKLLSSLPPVKADEVTNSTFRVCLARALKGEELTSEQYKDLIFKLINEFEGSSIIEIGY